MKRFNRNKHSLMYYYRYYGYRNSPVFIAFFLITFLIFSFIIYSNSYYLLRIYQLLPLPGHSSVLQDGESKSSNIPEPNPRQMRKVLSKYDQTIKYNEFDYLKPDTITYEKSTYTNNVEILYRLPKKTPISALLLIFHGCGRSSLDWFTTIERQRIIGAAIDLGYGCLAFQAVDDFTHCWANYDVVSENIDAQMVLKGLEGFFKEHPKLEKLPRFTFGASSGGMFSSVFATNKRYPIQGQILFISIVLPEVLEKYVKENKYPPTAWIYMTRDTEFASEQHINESMKVFAREKIPHKSFDIEPICLTTSTFHDRIPTINKDTSEFIFKCFRDNNWLDADGYFIHNPRRKNTWQEILFPSTKNRTNNAQIVKNLYDHVKVIPDFLNTIYGEHEISFERSYEALTWLQTFASQKG